MNQRNQSSNIVQLEHNGDIAYNAFFGQFKQIDLFQTASNFRFVGRRSLSYVELQTGM